MTLTIKKIVSWNKKTPMAQLAEKINELIDAQEVLEKRQVELTRQMRLYEDTPEGNVKPSKDTGLRDIDKKTCGCVKNCWSDVRVMKTYCICIHGISEL